jgi:two-component sensor histidine kinase
VTVEEVKETLQDTQCLMNVLIAQSPDATCICSLIVNQLVSSSLKHAFQGGRRGAVQIEMSLSGDRYLLTVSDNGIGFPSEIDFRNTGSLGMQLVSTLVSQLEGPIDLDCSAGTKFTITFPARRNTQGSAGR